MSSWDTTDQQALVRLHSEFEMQVYLCITFISILIFADLSVWQKQKQTAGTRRFLCFR